MKRGWALYQSLENLGFGLLDQPGRTVIAAGEKKVIEVHPHASFVVGLGWIPKTKQALAGQLERMAYLRVECAQLNINVTGTFLADDPLAMLLRLETTWDSVLTGGLDLPRISHDQLDAVAGLTTAIRAANGQAFAVGDTADGVIVVPAELAQLPYRGR